MASLPAAEAPDLHSLVREAGAALKAGRAQEALALYRQALAIDPTQPAALLGCVKLARRRGSPAEILACCEAALPHLPDRPHLRRGAAEALLALGRLPEARPHVAALLAQAPEAHDTHCAAAALATATGDHEAALRHGDAALALVPGDITQVQGGLRALEALGRSEEARERLAALLAASPGSHDLQSQAGRLAMQTGQPAEAAQHYERAAALRPGHAKTLIRLSDAHRALGRQKPAEAALRQLLETHPRNTEAMLRLGTLYQAQGLDRAARDMFLLASRTTPSLPEPWLRMARLANQHASFTEAMQVLAEGRRAIGETVPLLLVEAGLLQGRGLGREAEKCLALAEAIDPNDPLVRRQRLNVNLAQGRFDRARKALGRLPGATPAERANRLLVRGQIAEAQRDHAAARDAFREALIENVRLAAAHEGLGHALLFLRQPEAARASIVAARQLQAGSLALRGRSATALRGVLGEMINEARIAAAAGPREEPGDGGNDDPALLLRAHRASPDLTSLALAVLTSLRREGRLARRREAVEEASPIPRRLHQYWDKPVRPPEVVELMRSWRLENPGWTYRAHDRASARQYLLDHDMPEAARAFALARQPAQQADLFRLAILLREGGVYADADDRCVAPLDGALGPAEFLSWQEALGSVGNNFIAVVPGHPVIASALDQAVTATLRGDTETMWMSTGPGLLSRALVQYLAGDERRLDLLGEGLVILERWELRRFCMPHCKTSYKLSGEHWFTREMTQQAK